MKILLAVDGSEFTKKMLAYLATHEALFGPHNSYTLLTVNPQLPPRARSVVGKDVVEAYQREEAEKPHQLCQKVTIQSRQGNLMGTGKRSAAREWTAHLSYPMGRAGERVLRRAPCLLQGERSAFGG